MTAIDVSFERHSSPHANWIVGLIRGSEEVSHNLLRFCKKDEWEQVRLAEVCNPDLSSLLVDATETRLLPDCAEAEEAYYGSLERPVSRLAKDLEPEFIDAIRASKAAPEAVAFNHEVTD